MSRLFVAITINLTLVWPVVGAGKSEREHHRLLGPVKTIVIEESKLSYKSGKWVEGKRTLERAISYDRNGNMTKQEDYSKSPVVSKIGYRYDGRGNRTDSVYVEGAVNDFFRRGTREDDQNDIRQVRLIRWRFKYDSDNNRTEESAYSTVGNGPIGGEQLIERCVHTYDPKGRRDTTMYYDFEVLSHKLVYAFDSEGNVTESPL